VDELAALGAGVEVVSGPDGDPEELVPDERLAAARVARVIEAGGGADLVLCGDRSADRGTGAFGAFLAHELGVAQALGLASLGIDGDHLTGERRLEGGWRERVVVRGPAVCSVEGGLRLRRAPLGALLAASAGTHGRAPGGGDAAGGTEADHAAPRPGTGAAAPTAHGTERSRENIAVGPPRPHRARAHVVPPPVGGAHERLLALTGALTAHDPPALVGPVGAGEAAAAILEYLAHHGHAPEADGRAPEHHGHDPVVEAAP
jgi:electron transfer flavoprotein beta subunit